MPFASLVTQTEPAPTAIPAGLGPTGIADFLPVARPTATRPVDGVRDPDGSLADYDGPGPVAHADRLNDPEDSGSTWTSERSSPFVTQIDLPS